MAAVAFEPEAPDEPVEDGELPGTSVVAATTEVAAEPPVAIVAFALLMAAVFVEYAEPVTVEETAAAVLMTSATLWLDVGALPVEELPELEAAAVLALELLPVVLEFPPSTTLMLS